MKYRIALAVSLFALSAGSYATTLCQKDEVAERQQDLAEAKQKGDADKIAKRERKLAEAQEELKKLEARDY